MSKNVLVVKCNKEIKFDDWDNIVSYIKLQVGNEYHVVGVLDGIDIECISEKDKVFTIDGDKYSYANIKEAIENSSVIEVISDTSSDISSDTNENLSDESNNSEEEKEGEKKK